jgi:hypothetical protein
MLVQPAGRINYMIHIFLDTKPAAVTESGAATDESR